jgi:hypothetical protein
LLERIFGSNRVAGLCQCLYDPIGVVHSAHKA